MMIWKLAGKNSSLTDLDGYYKLNYYLPMQNICWDMAKCFMFQINDPPMSPLSYIPLSD